MRRQVNSRSGFFVRKVNPRGQDLNIDDLREAFNNDNEDARAILNSITRFSGALRGTRPYWRGCLRSLESMVRQLGSSHFFLTLSAADLHWPELMQHMPNYQEWLQASPVQRLRIAREALRDNPTIAD